MREIKFRAWDGKRNRWLHNYEDAGGCSIYGETIIMGAWMSEVSILDLKEVTVEQFTGLKDKHGKEIYEGDILKFDEAEWGAGPPDNHMAVEWSKYEGWSAGGTCSDWEEWCEIIGNIHENPELIK